jgi:hypothetical protein
MGGPSYSSKGRFARAESRGYAKKSIYENFTQSKVKRIHESMDPKKIRLRESRDNTDNPKTFPIIFGMDVTGSMGDVPQMLIIDGLPKMISKIIQKGIESPALLFLAIGDSQVGDSAPLQVGQFESGDLQMDTWLERVWPEGGGGGNPGESYLWAWYFAAKHTVTDAWDKRNEKGVLITFGDEPCLDEIRPVEMKEVMDIEIGQSMKREELLKAAQDKWNVFHIHLSERRAVYPTWREMLGQNLIMCDDYRKIPDIIAKICIDNCSYCGADKGTGEGAFDSGPEYEPSSIVPGKILPSDDDDLLI